MMQTVGWVGLGKLGLTCALALARWGGVQVLGYDVSDAPARILAGTLPPHKEKGLEDLIAAEVPEDKRLHIKGSLREVVAGVDEDGIIFVSVQTPHNPRFGGETPPPFEETCDFEYGFLTSAVRDLAGEAFRQKKSVTLVVVSTVLPGTSRTHLMPALNQYVRYVYNPFFIAMGTTVQDFLRPEFVLIGSEDGCAAADVQRLYRRVHNCPVRIMSVESAELTKVAYNTFISMKIVFANTLMEICHKTGADVDEVTAALAGANQRITSGAYMSGGMGDGGGCHPRDNIAMSDLVRRLRLHGDPFSFVTNTRTWQSGWLTEIVSGWAELTGLPVTILGYAFKPESDLTLGSPALLLAYQLRNNGLKVSLYDPHVVQESTHSAGMVVTEIADRPAVFFIGTKHTSHLFLDLPKGSVVIDPFGYFPNRDGITVVSLGRKK